MSKITTMFFGFYKYKNLLTELVVRDIKIRYRKSVLGLLWTLLNPLMMMLVMTMVFSALFRFEIEYYPVYLLTASILFSFNSEASTQAMTSVIANAGLIKKVYIPKYLFPLSRVLSSIINLGFAFLALLIVMVVTNVPFHPSLFLALVPIFYLIMFTTGLSLTLSAITVFFRDVQHLYGVFTMLWTYMTPIFYPISIIPKKYEWIFVYNPMYYYIDYFRELVLYGHVPGMEANLICFLIGFITLIIGLVVFYKSQDKFILNI